MHASPLTIAVGCFAAGSLAAVGIANATSVPTKIPDSNTGVITACYQKKGGAVRFINAQNGKTCAKKEKKVTFNQTGPQGAQGVQGERGPSNGYVAKNPDAVGISNALMLNPPPTRNSVVIMTLPAGNYIINASTRARKTNNTTKAVSCSIQAVGGTVTSVPVTEEFDNTGANDYHALAVTGSYSNTASAQVFLRCTPASTGLLNGAAETDGATITATKVADLTVL